MSRTKGLFGVAVAGALTVVLAGCATVAPPAELVAARQSYDRAKGGNASQFAPAQLHDAQETLAAAEKRFQDDGDEPVTRDLAYIAQRKAVFAEAYGSVLAAKADTRRAAADTQALRAQRLANVQSQLGQAQEQLGLTRQQLEAHQQRLAAEEQARLDAERRAQEALTKLEGATLKKQGAGTIITLSGNFLFASGKAELLGTAQQKLQDLAKAIKDDPRHVRVLGHTDAQGDDAYNMTLSQRRAEAVRTFLIAQGVSADAVTPVGMGETQPVASNDNAEGRANNRRVEIVLEDPNATGATTSAHVK